MNPDFRKLFESAPSLYLVLSAEFVIVAVSDAYLNATMTKREEIIGKGIFEVFPDNPDDPAASGVGNLSASLHRVLKNKIPDAMAVQKYDIPKPKSQGGGFDERFWSPLNTPVIEGGKLLYIIHQVTDVTEFVRIKQKDSEQNKLTEELKVRAERMESEIIHRAQQLQEANQKLRDSERIKDEFFANISHELRTPLSLIIAPLETLLSGNYTPDSLAKYLQTIHNNTIRLLQMVNGLLDFSKFEAGKMTVVSEPTDINILIRSILHDFEPIINEKKLSMTVEMSHSEILVMIDRYIFERILFNIISNAIKFSNEGGKIFVKIFRDNPILRLSIEDKGIGIAESDIKNLFKKFHQVEGSSIRRYEGTGLGLAMVKEFTELLGGTVHVSSTLGKGSIFTIEFLSLPSIKSEVRDIQSSQKRTLIPRYSIPVTKDYESLPKGLENNLKVLVCEDNEELSEYIVSLLHGICQLKTAKDGVEGLNIILDWKPDLVLSDVMMPNKDGITLCKEIKSNPDTSKIIVVLLTALTYRDAMLSGWDAGADEYLFKPFHPDELVTRIRSLLSNINERRKSADLIEQKNRELENSNAELEAFSYSVSHDLRAPLRSIDGYSRIILEDYYDKIDDEGKKSLDRIMNNAKKMGRLIDDLLDFSKVGRKELQKNYVDMNVIVNSVLAENRNQIDQRNIDFKIHNLPASVVDMNLIKQVWVNLISNAIKYTRVKENAIVEIGSLSDEKEVIYFIKDNGVGFEMQYIDKLFKVFQRLHKEKEFEGTGVGLAIVHRIISRHHGRVWAESETNVGATFYFTIPKHIF